MRANDGPEETPPVVENRTATTNIAKSTGQHCHFYTASFPSSSSNSSSSSTSEDNTAREKTVAVDSSLDHVPQKCIKNEAELVTFTTSTAYRDLINFITDLGNHVRGCVIQPDRKEGSEAVQAVCSLLTELEKMTEEFPPVQQAMRFGNQAFRAWYDAVAEVSRAEGVCVI
eukprot:GHVS01005487.1.p1 GENE.GHVS01005487.1~~GHVS01005487.1.p1  ORF type:complete len:171 (+),score=50.47 GHVS01005487.1:131-643(+)